MPSTNWAARVTTARMGKQWFPYYLFTPAVSDASSIMISRILCPVGSCQCPHVVVQVWELFCLLIYFLKLATGKGSPLTVFPWCPWNIMLVIPRSEVIHQFFSCLIKIKVLINLWWCPRDVSCPGLYASNLVTSPKHIIDRMQPRTVRAAQWKRCCKTQNLVNGIATDTDTTTTTNTTITVTTTSNMADFIAVWPYFSELVNFYYG